MTREEGWAMTRDGIMFSIKKQSFPNEKQYVCR